MSYQQTTQEQAINQLKAYRLNQSALAAALGDKQDEINKQQTHLTNIEKLAIEGYHGAIFELAHYYLRERSNPDFVTPQGLITIKFWLEEAAHLGDTQCMVNLMIYYARKGGKPEFGYEQDILQAKFWLDKLQQQALAGDQVAAFDLNTALNDLYKQTPDIYNLLENSIGL